MSVLTDRDRKLVDFIGRFGVATVGQVKEYFNLGRTVSYRRIRALKTLEYVNEKKILLGAPNILKISGVASKVFELPIGRIKLHELYHNLCCNEIITYLAKTKYWDYSFLTARELQKYKYKFHDYNREHIPDGVFYKEDLKANLIAIELELHTKTQKRYNSIIDFYCRHNEYSSVIYICNSGTYRKLKELFKKIDYISVVKLTDLDIDLSTYEKFLIK